MARMQILKEACHAGSVAGQHSLEALDQAGVDGSHSGLSGFRHALYFKSRENAVTSPAKRPQLKPPSGPTKSTDT